MGLIVLPVHAGCMGGCGGSQEPCAVAEPAPSTEAGWRTARALPALPQPVLAGGVEVAGGAPVFGDQRLCCGSQAAPPAPALPPEARRALTP